MQTHHSTPDPLLALRTLLDGRSPEQTAVLAGIATAAVSQALPLLSLRVDDEPAYTPHPLDVLVFAVLDSEGARIGADILAALDKDTYHSRGQDRKVTPATLNRRLAELVEVGVLSSTAAGYAIADPSAIDKADAAFDS